jgi:glutamyl-tRNA reductase
VDLPRAERALRAWLARSRGADLLTPGLHYRHVNEAACRHLCRVAAGLDSRSIGEVEILGQLRSAADLACAAGTGDASLLRVVQGAIHAGRQVRIQTRIATGVTSVPAAAVALAERVAGALADRSALVIGAGQAARIAMACLTRRRVGSLVVANRSASRGLDAAQRVGAQARALDTIGNTLAEVDLVIAAASSPEFLVTVDAARAAVRERPQRPLVLVDVAVPATVAPGVSAVEGVRAFTLGDVQALIEQHAGERRAEVPRAEAIAAEEALRLLVTTRRLGGAVRAVTRPWGSGSRMSPLPA